MDRRLDGQRPSRRRPSTAEHELAPGSDSTHHSSEYQASGRTGAGLAERTACGQAIIPKGVREAAERHEGDPASFESRGGARRGLRRLPASA